jgi:hypothetical protein
MAVDRWLRAIAGFFILLTVALGYYTSAWWFAFTALVGLNLLQSAFSDRCPMMAVLDKLGVPRTAPTAES